MAKIETYDLDKFEFEISAEGLLYITTDYSIADIHNVFALMDNGDLYFTDIMPWKGLYWELLDDGSYVRREGV